MNTSNTPQISVFKSDFNTQSFIHSKRKIFTTMTLNSDNKPDYKHKKYRVFLVRVHFGSHVLVSSYSLTKKGSKFMHSLYHNNE